MTEGLDSIENLPDFKLKDATWTYAEIKKLKNLIDEAYKQLNVKFVNQTKDLNTVQTVNLTKIKENKKIYDAFIKKREEHIDYFKKFPKYVKGRTQKHLDQIVEHLEESKKSLTFDAQKLANVLNLTEGMCRRHANFIARDQLGKFSSAINEAQAEYIGAKEYIWRTSLDNRVRHSHAEREGEKYRYDQPPDGGNPGMDYRCRCTAEAIIHLGE